MNARKGPGADTGNAGHFAKTPRPESATSLNDSSTIHRDRLAAAIENSLRDDLLIALDGVHPAEAWPLDSGDFNSANTVAVDEFTENLANTPDWATNLEAFTEALPTNLLICSRVESAWSYGTMGPDDFDPVAECPELVAEIQVDLAAAYNNLR